MKAKLNLAIVGATELIGNEIVVVLDQQNIELAQISLLDELDAVGENYKIGNEEVQIEELTRAALADQNIVVFAGPAEMTEQFLPIARDLGAVVIDVSRTARPTEGSIAVVPSINSDSLKGAKLITSPTAITVQLAPILALLENNAGLERVVISTYHSASSAGKQALDELWDQARSIFNQRDVTVEEFPYQLAFNCIPQIDLLRDDGYTREETRIIEELRSVLKLPKLRVTATAVRIPVLYAHSASVNVELSRAFSAEAFVAALSKTPDISVASEGAEYPMPLTAAGSDEIHIGRIRADDSVSHGLNFWVVADNVRRGAALNVVENLSSAHEPECVKILVHTVKLVIEYDGSGFHGWQSQPGIRTIQTSVHRVLEKVLRQKVSGLHSAGRTDAGVHAKGQVVAFRVEDPPDLHVVTHAVSSLLKGEVSVLEASEVEEGFDARRRAISKQYVYTILNRAAPAVLDRGRVWHLSAILDVEKMRSEAEFLVCTHDFSSVRAVGCCAVSPVRTIFASELSIEGEYLRYRVVGEGFLKQMVRNIVGTLVALGRGRLALGSMNEVLSAKDRRVAGPTAPAHGLCMEWVKYQA